MNSCILSMKDFNKIDGSEGSNIKKRESRKCDVCHYWYFLNYSQMSAIYS